MKIEELITEHIDIWTSAQETKTNGGRGRGNGSNGQTQYGIKKLRELILELAVRGKLVPQDTNDEPASVLLDKIAKEKKQDVKEGKIKKQKSLPEIGKDEEPFDLPNGWAWFRAGNVFDFKYGKALPAKSRDEAGSVDVYGSNGVVGKHIKALIEDPCIIIGRKGSAGALNKALRPSWTTDVAYFLISPNGFDYEYTFLILQSLRLDKLGKGIKPGVNRNEAYILVAALPPLKEQQRIVTKVNELMTLCDQIEQTQTDNNESHQALVETLLASLTSTTKAKDFGKIWQHIADNFDILFTTEHSIDQLKQTILQLAVMGKLVQQDPNDEPASELLEKIAKEKKHFIKEGKIKKQKALPEIGEDEKPFELPNGWCFVRLLDLCKLITKGSSPKWQGVAYTGDPMDVLFVTSENVGSYTLKLESRKYVEKKFNEVEPRSILNKGDFLMNIVGASIGRTAIYDIDDLANINQAVCLIRVFLKFLNSKYLLHFFNSEVCVSYMFDKQVDNARANLSMGNIAKFIIPFPPLCEQNRIVAKVDELMTLCEKLKTRLTEAQNTQLQMTDAIVEQAVA